jgi:hypothetical protein
VNTTILPPSQLRRLQIVNLKSNKCESTAVFSLGPCVAVHSLCHCRVANKKKRRHPHDSRLYANERTGVKEVFECLKHQTKKDVVLTKCKRGYPKPYVARAYTTDTGYPVYSSGSVVAWYYQGWRPSHPPHVVARRADQALEAANARRRRHDPEWRQSPHAIHNGSTPWVISLSLYLM